ncbi:bifunctional 4-hydroxy-2-oxoglutarate aldolase/2-dehydro-3-deoxy-phosphogluconate aldolase [Enterococcus alishanensis]|uniref:Bifunctional 4-hydroxy-2-oxoglutarate aldolase/2-dehydro-3-deoxy-phosphogluconate aldolase n=1 Tax=Enterococcus alishanensis TaxID=1303817 RepID=A0ABS6TE93_9ENTE|nr:bifunctional 4-hydroxy-2-oxoglutarate aldolase/2-dehydro-3-deoxy-phosphogluconate aldolase [Enterococcus alishanensis]MBV7391220.1 bifunctional 4-hydroxy-2-oxoglutarate aldolase/2-dehydro-3-deoxy-phosphogluconate aldolase [Enterococcus alishanensis]
MKQHPVYLKMKEARLLPLYTATDLTYLPIVEKILVDHSLPLIEVTFRSDLAVAAIKQLSASGDLMVGAGTVKTKEQAVAAIENGAQFIVSPAIVPEVVLYCKEKNIPVFPGVATPGDLQRALELGLDVVKFFPADVYGGLKAIKALSGPYFEMSFVPTGGINKNNLAEYLSFDKILAVGGSFILSEDVVKEDNGEKASLILDELMKIK